ncbi:MAG TPA: WD40 repeat domain-containing protein [Ktedonobacteraceae bacterium]|jgi:WD40 repeat protein
MFLQIHPTRSEALTASETTLTRWSLTTNPATILTQISTAPGTLFDIVIDPGGRMLTFGGITRTPDGEFFALQQPQTRLPSPKGSCIIEWRRWNDLLPERTVIVPQATCSITSMDSSPNGRWLVIDNDDHLFLLDWHTGEVISRHFSNGYATSGLAFDPTSTFVAGLSFADGGGGLGLWRLDPEERFVPRPEREEWPSHKRVPQDYVDGSVALTLVHEDLDRTNIAWNRDLADTACATTFSPDSRIVIFSLNSSYSQCGIELVAYEVLSGRRLWYARSEQEGSGACAFTPDGLLLLVPVQGSELLVYSAQYGTLLQRLQAGCDEPVQALAFDHHGTTLWLAGETALWQYQAQS